MLPAAGGFTGRQSSIFFRRSAIGKHLLETPLRHSEGASKKKMRTWNPEIVVQGRFCG
jgi:hypothetical protein